MLKSLLDSELLYSMSMLLQKKGETTIAKTHNFVERKSEADFTKASVSNINFVSAATAAAVSEVLSRVVSVWHFN